MERTLQIQVGMVALEATEVNTNGCEFEVGAVEVSEPHAHSRVGGRKWIGQSSRVELGELEV